MKAVIHIGHIEAVLENGRWHCEYPGLERSLNRYRDMTPQRGYKPNPLKWQAQSAAEAFGGEVVYVDEGVPGPPGTVY